MRGKKGTPGEWGASRISWTLVAQLLPPSVSHEFSRVTLVSLTDTQRHFTLNDSLSDIIMASEQFGRLGDGSPEGRVSAGAHCR